VKFVSVPAALRLQKLVPPKLLQMPPSAASPATDSIGAPNEPFLANGEQGEGGTGSCRCRCWQWLRDCWHGATAEEGHQEQQQQEQPQEALPAEHAEFQETPSPAEHVEGQDTSAPADDAEGQEAQAPAEDVEGQEAGVRCTVQHQPRMVTDSEVEYMKQCAEEVIQAHAGDSPGLVVRRCFEELLQSSARTGGNTISVFEGHIMSQGMQKCVRMTLRMEGHESGGARGWVEHPLTVVWSWNVHLESS